MTLALTLILKVIQSSTYAFRKETPIFDLVFKQSEKFYVQIEPLNDLEAEDQGHFLSRFFGFGWF